MPVRLTCPTPVRIAALAAAVASAAPSTVPPLPEGAYPEWSAAKAWQVESATRQEICLNGLWRFHSEPRLKPTDVVETLFEEDIEAPGIGEWAIGQVPGGTIRVGADATRKARGNASMRVELDVPKATNLYHVTRLIQGIPTGVKLVLRVDVWTEMEQGDLHLELQDARDYTLYTARGGSLGTTGEWKTIECEFMLPADTKTLKVFIPRNHGSSTGCKGTVWIDNLRIVRVEHTPAPGVAPPNNDAWGFAKVPGSWRGKVYWHEQDAARERPGDLRFAWFERTVEVPANWAGRRILARFDQISTDARIYCDGVEAGALGYDGGAVDVTAYARPGETLTLSVLVEARDKWVVLPTLVTRPHQAYRARLALTGLVGDVFLVSEPAADLVRLGDCRIVTSVRDRRLDVTAELSPPAGHAIPSGSTLRCDVRDGNTVVKTIEADVRPGAKSTTCTGTWADAALWEVGKPRLYTMTVSLLQGERVIDQTLPESFGFREFEIRGRHFYLNGVKLNLVPCSYSMSKGNWMSKEAMRHWLGGAQAAGYNFVYLHGTDHPGTPGATSHLLEVCDDVGMLAAVGPLGLGHSTYQRFDQPDVWGPWTQIAERRVRRDWNHPSLVMWRMNMNLNCYAQDQNPLTLDGKMDFEPGSSSAAKEAAMLKTNAFVQSLDPTRPTYNHACGKTGDVYTLNNYLGWPELQDLREWLRVWAQQGETPLLMAEQATPYPGDFQMRDPTNWWTNEPVMTEYGAILLGERSYALEEHDYVDYYDRCWKPKERTWGSSYGYFCFNYPPILDECSSRYYEVLLPAWRTWGISGGVNAWENTWRRLIKRRPGSSYREVPPPVPLDTDWAHLQRPGFSGDEWVYANGGGGEIRSLFDLGRPEEREYLEPTLRGKVMPQLIAPLYAYIAGPRDEWFSQDHAYRSGEEIAKSVVVLNDLRETRTFVVSWRWELDGTLVSGGTARATVAPAESARLQLSFRVPAVAVRALARITADVTSDGRKVSVKPYELQIYPRSPTKETTPAGWALFDPVGKTRNALRKAGLSIAQLDADSALPAGLRVLVVGCGALDGAAGARLFTDLTTRLAAGLQVLVFEQSADTLSKTFGLRCFTPGSRRLWVRAADHPALAGIANVDLADWRGQTTLGPLDGPPASLDERQRWKRVWRCSRQGVVASTIVEKPHISGFRPLIDTGFDLRYTALWEVAEGAGRMLFCQLDVTDRIGLDPVADTLLRNLIADLTSRNAPRQRTARRVADSVSAPLRDLAPDAAPCPADGAGTVLVLPRGSGEWLTRNRVGIPAYLASGGRIVAAGLTADEGRALAHCVDGVFGVKTGTLWLNPLAGRLPRAFSGVSPAGVHWRRKVAVTTVSSVPVRGWRSETGVLAAIPVGSGEIVWIAALPGDFDPASRPDLVFTRVNTERLYSLVLSNLGVPVGTGWSSRLAPDAPAGNEAAMYTDQRLPRDDPYADMRW